MRDDGAGSAAPGAKPGFGLAGMRERVEALGGALVVDSVPESRLVRHGRAAGRAAGGRRMRILLVEDHAIVRDGLKRLLGGLADAQVVEAGDGRQALATARAEAIDLVVLDLNLPGLGGLELLRRLRGVCEAKILVLSMHAEPLYAARALDAGAAGYVSKNASPDELIAAVQRVAAGGRYVEGEIAQALALQGAALGQPIGQLSAREMEIMRLLASGNSLAEIAEALGVGYKTVANTASQMKVKLGVARTADLVRLAIETGVS